MATRSKAPKKAFNKKATHKKATVRVSQSSLAGPIVDAIEHVASELDLAAALDPAQTKALVGLVNMTPTTLVEQIASTADRHGALLGTEFPSDEARVVIAYAAAFEPVVAVMSDVSTRLAHDILTKRAAMARAALASYAALRGVVRTPAGKPMKGAYEKMRLIMKEHRKGSGKKKGGAKAAAKADGPAPTNGAAPSPTDATPAK